MGDRTGIEWTDATWNPVRGCSRVSKGCMNCYAERVAARFSLPGQPYHGIAEMRDGSPRWTGKVRLIEEHLEDPLKWKRPRRVFVNSMSDLFHEELTREQIGRVFGVMAASPRHTFQVLTKRPERMREWMASPVLLGRGDIGIPAQPPWPLPNVWLGVSAEDQASADQRIPLLLATPAIRRFVSAEPLIGPIDFEWHMVGGEPPVGITGLDWIIVGGESGPGARPMHPAWALSIRDQCVRDGVPFFFKQWGEWAPRGRLRDAEPAPADNRGVLILNEHGNTRGTAAGSLTNQLCEFSDGSWCEVMWCVGKKAAGAILDGREWREMPAGAGEPQGSLL